MTDSRVEAVASAIYVAAFPRLSKTEANECAQAAIEASYAWLLDQKEPMKTAISGIRNAALKRKAANLAEQIIESRDTDQ